MTFKQIKQRLLEYIQQDSESYRDHHTPDNIIPVMDRNGCCLSTYTFEQLENMVSSANTMKDMETLVMKTLNFQWSASFSEVCEYAGINDITGNCV